MSHVLLCCKFFYPRKHLLVMFGRIDGKSGNQVFAGCLPGVTCTYRNTYGIIHLQMLSYFSVHFVLFILTFLYYSPHLHVYHVCAFGHVFNSKSTQSSPEKSPICSSIAKAIGPKVASRTVDHKCNLVLSFDKYQ